MKKQYDLIFGIGEACLCSQALRNDNLQVFSYPFDWVYGALLHNRVEILTNKFKDFFNKEDLVKIGSRTSQEEPRDNYKNNATNICFPHEFSYRADFNECYADINEKYTRRINRLLSQISTAKSILIVFVEIPNISENNTNNSDLLQAYNRIIETYGTKNNKIDFLYFTHIENFKGIKTETISDNITKITMDYHSKKKNAIPEQCNFKAIHKVFKHYSLNMPFKKHLSFVIKQYIDIGKLKRGFYCTIFPKMFNLLRIKLLFIGCRIDLSIGRKID